MLVDDKSNLSKIFEQLLKVERFQTVYKYKVKKKFKKTAKVFFACPAIPSGQTIFKKKSKS